MFSVAPAGRQTPLRGSYQAGSCFYFKRANFLATGRRTTAPRSSRRRVAPVEARRRHRWWPESWEQPPPKPEEIITVFGSDGTITNIPPVRTFSEGTSTSNPPLVQLPSPSEQGLCIGSVFTITATNGVDITRRMNVLGFCQSAEMLHDAVERSVARRGGEVFHVNREVKAGVHEALTMTLALPLLWGVPPEHERLKTGIESGGGIIDKTVWVWCYQGQSMTSERRAWG